MDARGGEKREKERKREENRLVKGEQFTMSSGAKTNSGTRGAGRRLQEPVDEMEEEWT